jgi:hypothetical protein
VNRKGTIPFPKILSNLRSVTRQLSKCKGEMIDEWIRCLAQEDRKIEGLRDRVFIPLRVSS